VFGMMLLPMLLRCNGDVGVLSFDVVTWLAVPISSHSLLIYHSLSLVRPLVGAQVYLFLDLLASHLGVCCRLLGRHGWVSAIREMLIIEKHQSFLPSTLVDNSRVYAFALEFS